VLSIGAILSLAANLAQAEPSPWGRIVAGTPAGAFLVAISMVERRARTNHAARLATVETPASVSGERVPPRHEPPTAAALAPAPSTNGGPVPAAVAPDALLGFAHRVAAEHLAKHGQPIDAAALRSRLGVSRELAEQLHTRIHHQPESAPV
jgi:hypothetical protein